MPETKEEMMGTFTAIGYVTVHWAHLETAIDQIVALAFRYAGAADLEEELPRSFKPKIKFLKRAIKALPPLAPFKADLAPLLTSAKIMARRRHEKIHGAIMTFGPEMRVLRTEYSVEKHIFSMQSSTQSEIFQLGHDIIDLGLKITLYANGMAKHFRAGLKDSIFEAPNR